MTTLINYRQDDETVSQLRRLAERNQRTLTDELRASNSVYLALIELAELRVDPERGETQRMFAEWEVKKRLSEVLVDAFPEHVLAMCRAEKSEAEEAEEAEPEASPRVVRREAPGESLIRWLMDLEDHPDD